MGCEDRREKRVLEAEETRWMVFLAELAATAIFSSLHQNFFPLSWGERRKSLPYYGLGLIKWASAKKKALFFKSK